MNRSLLGRTGKADHIGQGPEIAVVVVEVEAILVAPYLANSGPQASPRTVVTIRSPIFTEFFLVLPLSDGLGIWHSGFRVLREISSSRMAVEPQAIQETEINMPK